MKKLICNSKYEFRSRYFADDSGHIWSESKQSFLSEYEDKNGYKKVVLMTTDKPSGRGHRFSVHRLIMETFYPVDNMYALQVDHINGNCQDNSLSNLRWATVNENLNNPNTKPNRRVYDQDGTHNANAKLTDEQLENFVDDINSGNYTRKQICQKYNICDETLRKIINRQTYKDVKLFDSLNPKFTSNYSREVQGAKNPRSKLNEKQVKEIINILLTTQETYSSIAKKYNVSPSAISNIKNKKTWKYLTENINF